MTYLLPPTIGDIATKYRLKAELCEAVAHTSPHCYERREIGGTKLVVLNEKAFVTEARAARPKPMWKR